ncbi:cob(I)yrinic acid a,c-diamide adenosyltransferase [Lacimicrobium alkaliphilum]|uniref:Corrinoid adenosyltransferase n=1 Tax=Lacimicrobium alkaliphilum TaxID=1526571 RepID=A0ABQ1R275_9ALTE|nr:cob(I)yrinic acid a,c-diamide adenosyltransferase [Lacimicrobium alkaliphilum]GGD55469.1 cobalamin adenosyltransferase [Lacimicrobium alkaliphilum]
MKIYTKNGDQGTTQIYAGKPEKLDKHDIVLETYGSLDELNAQLGLLGSHLSTTDLALLQQVQRQLFQTGFALSANNSLKDEDIHALEQQIDHWQSQLPPQTHFILPGGSADAAQCHVCRTIARRAERQLVAMSKSRDVPPVCLKYINRLSDWLFMFARYLNQQANHTELKV